MVSRMSRSDIEGRVASRAEVPGFLYFDGVAYDSEYNQYLIILLINASYCS
jgi:hypothetical protein